MSSSSQKETSDFYTPSGSSSRSAINGVLQRRSSKGTIQSQESISNSSFHSATAAIDKDPFDLSGQGHLSNYPSNPSSGLVSSISDHKSSYSLEKLTFGFRNQSQSTVCTIRELESDHSSTATSTPIRSLCLSSPEDETEFSPPSTPHSSRATVPTLITDPSPNPSPVYADPPFPFLNESYSQPLATMEISTAVTPPVQKYQGLISNVNLHAAAATDHNRPVILPRKAPPKPSTGRSQEHKSDFSSPLAPFSHGASKITVEYHKPSMQSIQEYQELLSNVNLHAAAADYNDPFIPPRKALPSTNSQNDSKPSRSQDHKSHDSSSPLAPSSRGASKRTVEYHKPSRQFIQEYQELLSNVNPHSAAAANNEKFFEDFVIPPRQAPPPVSSHNASKPSRSRDHDSSVSHHKSISVKNKGVLSRMTNLLHLNKRPEISTPRDPVHLTHGGFNTSTGQFTGLPEEWQQLLQGNIDDHDDGVSVWEHLLRPPQSRREK